MVEALLKYEDAARMRKNLSSEFTSKINLSSNAEFVWREVYLKNLESGGSETVADRMAAIAIDVASADMNYLPESMPYETKVAHVETIAKKNLEMYVDNKFRANTPTNLNMGRWDAVYNSEGDFEEYVQRYQLGSACFVIPVEDTFGDNVNELNDGILEAWVTQQLVHKGGGGTGFSFQRLRPKGSIIDYDPVVDGMESISWEERRGVSSGYESFLNYFFNSATDAVKQGNSRRGANMGIQRIDHMDVLDHMFAKTGRGSHRDEYRIKNFNLSLAVTDEFMDAAREGRTYTLFNPHRARPDIKNILSKKHGIENPEIVREGDLATKEQFETILKKNGKNPFNPLTTPSMYLDEGRVINAYNGEPIGFVVDGIVRIEAKKILDTFSKLSYSNGEPGMIFIDRINEFNTLMHEQEIEATNPCGEQPLFPYGACNLGSINVGAHVRHQIFEPSESVNLEAKILKDPFTLYEEKDGRVAVTWFDWEGLQDTIYTATRFLDGVIDRSDFPAAKIEKNVKETRNIGLGFMGVYDAMVLMKRRYGSKESFEFADALAKFLHDHSLEASQELARERGAFPLFEKSSHNPGSETYEWINSNPQTIPDKYIGKRKLSNRVKREKLMTYGGGKVRNANRTTQAPTGTIRRSSGPKLRKLSLDNLAISSGIEPIFSLYTKDNILNSEVEDVSFAAAQLLDWEGLNVEKMMNAIKKNRGSVGRYSYTPEEVEEVLSEIPEDVRDVLVTAAGGEGDQYEIVTKSHIKMMEIFQSWNDSAISKTINLPGSATFESMENTWMNLWGSGVKGGTVYRDTSRKFQIQNVFMVPGEGSFKKGNKRPLAQRAMVFELPYCPSSDLINSGGDIDFNPGRVFTIMSYNPVNGGITGIFQNTPEVDIERISNMTELNIDKSRAFKNGRTLEEVISDLEKMIIRGAKIGVITDEAVMPNGSNERKRFEVTGATTAEARLHACYFMNYLTDGGKNFDDEFIGERLEKYYLGDVTFKAIINTRGRITLEEDSCRNPSILSNRKVVKMPEMVNESNCPECLG